MDPLQPILQVFKPTSKNLKNFEEKTEFYYGMVELLNQGIKEDYSQDALAENLYGYFLKNQKLVQTLNYPVDLKGIKEKIVIPYEDFAINQLCVKGYIEDNNLTVKEAFEHYQEGTGCAIRIPFNSIDTSSVLPSQFSQVQQELKNSTPRTVNIDNKLAYPVKDKNKYLLGNIILRLEGTLTIHKDKTWSFNGTLKSYDDIYDFNRSTHRKIFGEILTAIGRTTQGKEFDIQIRGLKSIEESGVIKK